MAKVLANDEPRQFAGAPGRDRASDAEPAQGPSRQTGEAADDSIRAGSATYHDVVPTPNRPAGAGSTNFVGSGADIAAVMSRSDGTRSARVGRVSPGNVFIRASYAWRSGRSYQIALSVACVTTCAESGYKEVTD